MDENAKKRKREEAGQGSDVELQTMESDQPIAAGLDANRRKTKRQKKDKKPKMNQELSELEAGQSSVASATAKATKRKEKREHKKASKEAKAARRQAKALRKEHATASGADAEADVAREEINNHDTRELVFDADLEPIDIAGLVDVEKEPSMSTSTATPSPAPQSPAFDIAIGISGTSSISSVATSTLPSLENLQNQPTKKLPEAKASPELLRARLEEKIAALRAARKADTMDGTPARNRQELMEARRRKEEQRKAHKKELRQKAREEELRQRDLSLARGSPLFSPALGSRSSAVASPLQENPDPVATNLSFGRIAFPDGQSMNASLDAIIDPHKRKGPQDPQTALQAANNKAERISSLDPAKRADIEEKDRWLNAKKRAFGEKIRDDSSLLKKTLKRKEKAKKKSEKEWGERIEGVQKSQAMKQKKREENLKNRREGKDAKGKGGKSKGSRKGKVKVKARPGFEGSFRAKVGGAGRK
jgi:hypothetical protein